MKTREWWLFNGGRAWFDAPLFAFRYDHFIQTLKATDEKALNNHILATSVSWGIIIMAFLLSQFSA